MSAHYPQVLTLHKNVLECTPDTELRFGVFSSKHGHHVPSIWGIKVKKTFQFVALVALAVLSGLYIRDFFAHHAEYRAFVRYAEKEHAISARLLAQQAVVGAQRQWANRPCDKRTRVCFNPEKYREMLVAYTKWEHECSSVLDGTECIEKMPPATPGILFSLGEDWGFATSDGVGNFPNARDKDMYLAIWDAQRWATRGIPREITERKVPYWQARVLFSQLIGTESARSLDTPTSLARRLLAPGEEAQ